MLNAEQLRTEAATLDADIHQKEIPPVEPPAPESPASDQQGAQPGAATEQPAPGGPDPEVIENPAPMIAAALKKAIAFPMAARIVPPRVLAVFDEATIEELSAAVGAVVVKWWPTIARWINASEKVSEEGAALWLLLCIGLRVYGALNPGDDGEQKRGDAAREINPEARAEWERHPPPPPTDAPPVEPIA